MKLQMLEQRVQLLEQTNLMLQGQVQQLLNEVQFMRTNHNQTQYYQQQNQPYSRPIYNGYGNNVNINPYSPQFNHEAMKATLCSLNIPQPMATPQQPVVRNNVINGVIVNDDRVNYSSYPLFNMDCTIEHHGDIRVLNLPKELYMNIIKLIQGKFGFREYLDDLLGATKPSIDYIKVDDDTAQLIYDCGGGDSDYNGFYNIVCKTFISTKVNPVTLGYNGELRRILSE